MSIKNKITSNRHAVGFGAFAAAKATGSIGCLAADSPNIAAIFAGATIISAGFTAVASLYDPQKAGYNTDYEAQIPDDSFTRRLMF